jgi:hypothetical protein
MLKNNLVKKVKENGISYYIIPSGYKLFKATKEYNGKDSCINLEPSGFYFFGEHNKDTDYIEGYEELYGIIFEFVTTREYKLLALDDKETQNTIYNNNTVPKNIKTILTENYGYYDNKRNSVGEKDKKISEYLCGKDYDGYAIQSMETDFGGEYHPEFMICKIDGVECVGRITSDKRVEEILKDVRYKKMTENLKFNRNRKNRMEEIEEDETYPNPKPKRLFNDVLFEIDTNTDSTPITKKLNFNSIMDIEQDSEEERDGGKYKKRKTNKKQSKKRARKTRKTRKMKKHYKNKK